MIIRFNTINVHRVVQSKIASTFLVGLTHAKLSMKAYTAQIVNACFLDKISPVSHWQDIFHSATSIKKWLNSMNVNAYHVESENVDLTITPGEKRKWIGISGHNIPSFEIFL